VSLQVVVRSAGSDQSFSHEGGALEFGRGPARELPRCVVADPHTSRDQLRIELQPDGRLLVHNLSHTTLVTAVATTEVPVDGAAIVDLPIRLEFGASEIAIAATADWPGESLPPLGAAAPTPWPVPLPAQAPGGATIDESAPPQGFRPPQEPPPIAGLETVIAPLADAGRPLAFHELGDSPRPETLIHWFETLVQVQQAAATSTAFLEATARAVVDLVGLDRGQVLLREVGGWQVAASFPPDAGTGRSPFSSTILAEVVRQRRTVFRNLGQDAMSSSLVGIDTVVAAPVLDAEGALVGVVYGSRSPRIDQPMPEITALEALVVQVLAAAVGAGLEREEQREKALRVQVQFEQFFTPRLVQQLEADPSLLIGREREVTVLFSDVRNFSRISERLGPESTFRMMQEVMDLQSLRIRETDGVVVDYVGDGLLAMWNAPAEQSDHPALACRAAAAFVRGLPEVADRWLAVAGEPLRLGVGIHTGPALVGNTGSTVKFKYGPMGPAVNLASRVEDATKLLGVSVLVTGATRARLGSAGETRRLGHLRVQGFTDPIEVFELCPDPTPEWRAGRDAFERALAHFERREWSEACQLLAGLLAGGQNYDLPSLQLLSRSVECLRSAPEPFDPALTVQKQG
jgi:adenylate cyclase